MRQLTTSPRTTVIPLPTQQLKERRHALVTLFLRSIESVGQHRLNRDKLHKAFDKFHETLASRGVATECLGCTEDQKRAFFEEILERAIKEKLWDRPSRFPDLLVVTNGFTQWSLASRGVISDKAGPGEKSELQLVQEAVADGTAFYFKPSAQPFRIRA